MSTTDNDNSNKDDISNICANCGKGEESTNSLKACTACKLVKYCNRECQIAHRPQHKKACKKRAAELHDELLFKEVEPVDCPICMIRMPLLDSGVRYMSCCGKTICCGCIFAPVYDDKGNVVDDTCPFCRTPPPTSNGEALKRMQKRLDARDVEAISNMGFYYNQGAYGLPQDYDKALEFYHQAGELGHAASYFNISQVYTSDPGAEVDMKKGLHYTELAAMKGHVYARNNLGCREGQAGNRDRALRHFMIAVKGGGIESLEMIRKMVTNGLASKDDYTKALESYQAYLDEIKSDQRDKAAAENDDCKYY